MSFTNPAPVQPLIDNARRLLAAGERELFDRLIAAGSTGTIAVTSSIRGNIAGTIDSVMILLGKLPHALANAIVDMDRGTAARRLTIGETAQVAEAFGTRIQPQQVRVVRGAGLSLFAHGAFLHGNPAITIGNTIYIKSDLSVAHADLSTMPLSIELLLHEYTHVVQYATLGFCGFGRRYLIELRANGNDPDKLYKYADRNRDWRHETLEGQAEIVGDYARARLSPNNPNSRKTAEMLRGKLRGTGIYAN